MPILIAEKGQLMTLVIILGPSANSTAVTAYGTSVVKAG